jgi:hypothetical protein
MTGTDDVGVKHGLQDTITTKHYWNKLIKGVGGRMPQQVFHWENNTLTINHPFKGLRIMSKLTDSYLGIGDVLLEHGKDFSDEVELKALLEEKYVSTMTL